MVPNHDVFSFLGLIWQADPVVKIVIFCLLGFSVASWSIIFSKYFLFRRLQFESYTFEKSFQRSDNLSNLFNHFCRKPRTPFAKILKIGLEVVQRDPHYADSDVEKRQEILTHQLNKSLVLETFSLERGLSFLSIVSSTAVFVGLFGTVWGIMHGFKAISAAQSTSLGVVAPAIAEALFATALGLIAAIPANVAFNRFTYFIHRYQSRLELFVQDIVLFLRRQ